MKIAVVKWVEGDGLSKAIRSELEGLGYESEDFLFNQAVPQQADMVMTFAPWDRLIPIAAQIGQVPSSQRPIFVHWSIEAPPDPSIPWLLMKLIGYLRLRVDLINDSRSKILRYFNSIFPLSWINNHFHRFRHVGEYCYAYRRGWLDFLFDTSNISAQFWRSHGLPAHYIPWGIPRTWYDNLNVYRDVDVLWMGKRRNRYRSKLIDIVHKETSRRNINMHIADGIRNPFIYGEERTKLLNRTKITLNIQTEPKKNILPMRFIVAAANRSLVLSEKTLPHAPEIKDGEHYISAPSNLLVNKIMHYLEHEKERQSIIEKAHDLTTIQLTMANSLRMMIEKVEEKRAVTKTTDSDVKEIWLNGAVSPF
jgi:hypothetical protein